MRTQENRWRFWTVPAKASRAGVETWAGESWKTGSASTWITGSYDPDLNIVYWGTGNPGPDWNGDVRAGDNLYSDCLVALDADTGKLKWHFQFTPHDVFDLDSTEVPVLFDGMFQGRPRKLVLFANRNAFYYVLDRETGTFLHGRPYAKQTWASQLDDKGRPVRVSGIEPTEEGLKNPAPRRRRNWYSPRQPKNNPFYAARAAPWGFPKGEPDTNLALSSTGGMQVFQATGIWRHPRAGPTTGELRWQYELGFPAPGGRAPRRRPRGGMRTGYFCLGFPQLAKPLGASKPEEIVSNPISDLSEGKQRVAIAAGHAICSALEQ